MIYGGLLPSFLEFSIGRLQISVTVEFTEGCSTDLVFFRITGYSAATATLCGGAWFLRKSIGTKLKKSLAFKSGK
jgi:hypothetical protein